MKFAKKPESTLLWFILAFIPLVNLYVLWKLAKVLANIEFERGD